MTFSCSFKMAETDQYFLSEANTEIIKSFKCKHLAYCNQNTGRCMLNDDRRKKLISIVGIVMDSICREAD